MGSFRLAVILTCFSLPTTVLSQTEIKLVPARILSLAQIIPSEWEQGLRPEALIGGYHKHYLVMVPTSGDHSLLVILTEDGSLLAARRLAPDVAATAGIDGAGNIILLRKQNSRMGSVETFAPDGTLIRSIPIGGSAIELTAREHEISIARQRLDHEELDTVNDYIFKSISHPLSGNHEQYVLGTLESGKTVRLSLTSGRTTIFTNAAQIERSMNRKFLDRYGTHAKSTATNVIYHDLMTPVLSPRGRLYTFVAGAQLSKGAIAIRVDPALEEVAGKVYEFELPRSREGINQDNPEGYLVPVAVSMCESSVVLLDTGTGAMAVYSARM